MRSLALLWFNFVEEQCASSSFGWIEEACWLWLVLAPFSGESRNGSKSTSFVLSSSGGLWSWRSCGDNDFNAYMSFVVILRRVCFVNKIIYNFILSYHLKQIQNQLYCILKLLAVLHSHTYWNFDHWYRKAGSQLMAPEEIPEWCFVQTRKGWL